MRRPQRKLANTLYTRWAIGVAIVLLAAPWIFWALTLPPRATPALVAVPANGRGLSANVATGFADARYFVVVDLTSRRVQSIENSDQSSEAVGIKSAYRVLDEGVGVLLVRTLRPEPLGALTANGVSVFSGGGRTVAEIVQGFVEGRLIKLSNDSSAIVAEPPPVAVAAAMPVAVDGARRPGAVPELGLEVVLAPTGLLVTGTTPGSRAQRAGMRRGDLLIELGQRPVRTLRELDQSARLLARDLPVQAWLEREGVRARLWIPP